MNLSGFGLLNAKRFLGCASELSIEIPPYFHNNFFKNEIVPGKLIGEIKNRVPLKAVILFGSYARGTAHKFSDYDLVIIADFQEDYFDRSAWIIKIAPFVSMDLFCYTPEEFEVLFSSYNLTAIDAIGEGIVLFGDEYIAPYRVRYADLIRRGMQKTQCVLIPPSL